MNRSGGTPTPSDTPPGSCRETSGTSCDMNLITILLILLAVVVVLALIGGGTYRGRRRGL